MEQSDVDRSLVILGLSLGGVSALIFVLAWLERAMRPRKDRGRPPQHGS